VLYGSAGAKAHADRRRGAAVREYEQDSREGAKTKEFVFILRRSSAEKLVKEPGLIPSEEKPAAGEDKNARRRHHWNRS